MLDPLARSVELSAPPPPPSAAPDSEETNLFRDRVASGDEYFYYRPLQFRSACIVCHEQVDAPVEQLFEEAGQDRELHKRRLELAWQKDKPIFFVRVALSYAEFRSAINRTTAILMAVAIATTFFAMLFLYLIVRYVIVKPLKHLQDVSDRISLTIQGTPEVFEATVTHRDLLVAETLATQFSSAGPDHPLTNGGGSTVSVGDGYGATIVVTKA